MTLKARKYPEQQGLLQACNKCHKAPIRGNKDKTLKCGPGKMESKGGGGGTHDWIIRISQRTVPGDIWPTASIITTTASNPSSPLIREVQCSSSGPVGPLLLMRCQTKRLLVLFNLHTAWTPARCHYRESTCNHSYPPSCSFKLTILCWNLVLQKKCHSGLRAAGKRLAARIRKSFEQLSLNSIYNFTLIECTGCWWRA